MSANLVSSSLPPIDAVRPRCCPHCGAIAGVPGGLNLWGHGARSHEVVVPGDRPSLTRVWVRRFLCRPCDKTCSVLPFGCLPRHLYSLWAILTAWFLAVPRPVGEGLDDEAVYGRVGVDRRAEGPEAGRAGRLRWRSLRRWLHCAARWWPTHPLVGVTWREQAAALLAGFIPGDGGREGATRRALSAHAAGGTVV
jgi:hypothetical protein